MWAIAYCKGWGGALEWDWDLMEWGLKILLLLMSAHDMLVWVINCHILQVHQLSIIIMTTILITGCVAGVPSRVKTNLRVRGGIQVELVVQQVCPVQTSERVGFPK